MRSIMISLILITLGSSQAHAFGIKSCGPQLDTGTSVSTDYNGDVKPMVRLGLKFDIGSHEDCKEYNKAKVSKEKSEAILKQNATVRDSVDTLFKKIQICTQFTNETAPGSIKEFCGDLVGVIDVRKD